MGKQRRKFEAGFKQQIVQEVESGLLSVGAASRKYQISGSVIDRWRRQARQGGLDTAPSARERVLERENRELKKKERLAELYLEVDHLKKLGDWLRRHKNGTTLATHSRGEFGSIAQGIEIMKLASSSYYYKAKSDAEGQASSDAELRDHIERIQEEVAGYGYRRLGKRLRREGICVNDKRIRRVQRHYQLFPIRWQSFKIATTDSNHRHKVYPNRLAELTLTGTNQAWVADITYIRILKGFVYLAALLDRYSRKVIGWAISKRIDAELCLAALKIALDTRQPPSECIHHSDRGVQYACHEYVAMLEAANLKISMSRTGNPYDNAHMESFLKTLKYEEVHLSNYGAFR